MCKGVKCFIIAAVAICVIGCGADTSRREAATGLVEQARSLIGEHRYDSALVVLDTLDVKYRDCLEERREGTRVRLEALGALTRDSLASAELRLRAVNLTLDSLAPLFRKVEVPGTDGYFIDKAAYPSDDMNTTDVRIHVDEDGYCSLVAIVQGRKIGLQSVAYGDLVTPAKRSIVVENSEILSLMQEQAAPMVEALCKASGKVTLELIGKQGKVSVVLNAKQLEAIRNSWNYGMALQERRRLSIHLEKLERQLAKVSDQLVNQTEYQED